MDHGAGWGTTLIAELDAPDALRRFDDAAQGHPVVLVDNSRHNRWVNSAAMERIELPDDPGVLRDASGGPTGVLLERAGLPAAHSYAAHQGLDAQQEMAAYRYDIDVLHGYGVTDSGALVAAGSDWPVSPLPNPWEAICGIVTRTNSRGETPGELWPGQAIALDEALRVFTINGARMLGIDEVTGSLEPGKSADLIILDADPFALEPEAIARIRVSDTWVSGDPIHRADTAARNAPPDANAIRTDAEERS